MVEFFDITDWISQPWYNTGGTRDKKYVQSPNGEYYFFKTSLLKPKKDYQYEFWNEIITYHLGTMLGFNMLKYDIAIDGNRIGCLSKSMINNDSEDLNEGGKYLQAFDNSFDPEDRKQRGKYSFQLIEETLIHFQLDEYLSDLIEVIVFDAIIGNSDRHQENWAFIIDLDSPRAAGIAKIERLIKHEWDELPRVLKWVLMSYKDKKEKRLKKQYVDAQITLSKPKSFAPIYDNGCCLGRELLEEKVALLCKNKNQLISYVNRGKSEVHWESNKINHFTLLKNISGKHESFVKEIVMRVSKSYDRLEFKEILNSIDETLKTKHRQFLIPQDRKNLIFELVDARINKIKETFN